MLNYKLLVIIHQKTHRQNQWGESLLCSGKSLFSIFNFCFLLFELTNKPHHDPQYQAVKSQYFLLRISKKSANLREPNLTTLYRILNR